jgi:hypothetical protein
MVLVSGNSMVAASTRISAICLGIKFAQCNAAGVVITIRK